MKLAVAAAALAVTTGSALGAGDLIISEVVDGSLTGGLPKFVEITNTSGSPIDLSGYSLGNINNGAAAMQFDALVLAGILAPGDSYVVSYENNDGPGIGSFFTTYGFDADNFTQGSFINGDDVLVLFLGAGLAGDPADGSAATVLDKMGVVGQSGVGQPWEYTDSYALRNADVIKPTGEVFAPAGWTFGGPNALAAGTPEEELALLLALTTPGTHTFIPMPGAAGLLALAACSAASRRRRA